MHVSLFAAPFVNFSYQILVEEVPCWDRKWGSGHLGSVGLPFLGVTSGAPVHSVLRLGSVQQHLRIKMRTKTKIETRMEVGDAGDEGDLETGDSVQLRRLLINFA